MSLKSYRPNPLVSRSGGPCQTQWSALGEESQVRGQAALVHLCPTRLGTGGFSLL
jgi:hypothetical protein